MDGGVILTVIIIGGFLLFPVLIHRRNTARSGPTKAGQSRQTHARRQGHKHSGRGRGGCCH